MNSSQLKILACVLMLVDHIGAVLFPKVIILRMIGRLAFPIFAYMIAEGYRRTKDVADYLGRLFIFALVSQLPFNAAFLGSASKPRVLYFNIFFTLAAGLYALYLYEKYKKLYLVGVIGLVCQIINTDYGVFGVLLIFIFHKYYEDFKSLAKNFVILMFAFELLWAVMTVKPGGGSVLSQLLRSGFIYQPLCLISLLFIRNYNGERGYNLKYLFYAFYPVHLIILSIIKRF